MKKKNYNTELDYIKILLEENRIGEALNNINILKTDLFTECINIKTNSANLILPKKVKAGENLYLNNHWFKYVRKQDNKHVLEIAKDILVEVAE